ncbi:MAG: NAD(P)-dependent oxidoreductase [Rhizobiaceae bacterium]
MKILLTGSGGRVASYLRPMFRQRYGGVVLSDRTHSGELADGEEFHQAELSDFAAVSAACAGMDAIVHLGGQPVEAPWPVIRDANIEGAYNIFEAARLNGVKRVVFASTNHAVGMYSRDRRIGTDHAVRPDTRYGASKAFGEALGSLYADKHGVRVLSIRIGNVLDRPANQRSLSIWVHPEDLFQLITIGLEHPDLHNEIVYGVSHNARTFWDNAAAFRLGYKPKHVAEDHAAPALAKQATLPPDPIGDRLQGGSFCTDEFSGDIERTLSRK